ncbi:MAG: hypothetical protein SP4CHLAM5_08610 [Chlamydiia bacterium]|nr:hypothetical protein [Chlamydiia bacterium]MCH9618724.1 hypothetical protein [Chlamydiia bacterium]
MGNLNNLSVESPIYKEIYSKVDRIRRCIKVGDHESLDGMNKLTKDLESLVERFKKRDEHLLALKEIMTNITNYIDFKGHFLEVRKKLDDMFVFWRAYIEDEGRIMICLDSSSNNTTTPLIEVIIDDLD